MRAVRVHEYGGPEVMRCDELQRPDPGPNTVLVKIQAAGVNFIDTYQRKGLYRGELPFTLGQEAAGVVEATGAGVTELRPGDLVAYTSHQGAYADYAVVPASKLVRVPDGVSAEQAAAVILQGITAHYLSHSTYPLQPGDTVLIHAAAGGAGRLLVQLAKRRGARVLATVSTAEKAELARSGGADEIILYTEEDFEAATKRLTDGRGVDVVYDSVGQATFDKSLNCLRPRGYLVLFGQSSGPVAPLDPQVLNAKGSLFLTRPTIAHYIADRQELVSRTEDLFAWLAAGELDVRIDLTLPLEQAAEAHRYLEGRRTKGKVLLIP